MYPSMRNPLVEREKRMKARSNKERIQAAINQLSTTAHILAGKLSGDERDYLRYLCGLEPKETDALTPEQKARIGNFFERAYRKQRTCVRTLPEGAMPGLTAVYANRKVVVEGQKAAAKRKR